MEEPTSSTKGNKMKSPCASNKRKVDKEEEKDLVFLGACACLEEHIKRSVLYVGDSDTLSKMKTSKSPPSGHIPQSGVFCNSPNAVSN
uniref:Uncharacterized protein n=1 Tax=Nomascus leucogenys TaxID=61853 RepID=A0A2I3H5S7_NOMLE